MSYVEEVDGEAVSWHFEQDRLFSKQRVEIIALTTKSSMRVNFSKKEWYAGDVSQNNKPKNTCQESNH